MARWPLIRCERRDRRLKRGSGAAGTKPPSFLLRKPLIRLNLGVNYYYQIDTVVLLQIGTCKPFFDAGQAWCSSNIRLARSRSQTCQLLFFMNRSALGGQRTVYSDGRG